MKKAFVRSWLFVATVTLSSCGGGGAPTSEASARAAVLGRWHQYQSALNMHEILDFKNDGTVDLYRAHGSGDYKFDQTKRWNIHVGRYSDTRETYYAAMMDGWRTQWIIKSPRRLWNQNGDYSR